MSDTPRAARPNLPVMGSAVQVWIPRQSWPDQPERWPAGEPSLLCHGCGSLAPPIRRSNAQLAAPNVAENSFGKKFRARDTNISSRGTRLQDNGTQDDLFFGAMATCGPAIGRLVRAYEYDPSKQADLSQEIQVALWQSFAVFDGRCSIHTWVYRIAHNVAAAHVVQARRSNTARWISLDEVAEIPQDGEAETEIGASLTLDRLRSTIHRLRPPDAQIMMLWLEGEDAATIGEITGVAPGAVATKVHRIKAALARQFNDVEPRQ